jgi:hypothetical protein
MGSWTLKMLDLKPYKKLMVDLREFVTGKFYRTRWSNPVDANLSSLVIS